jgi:hypothetical protein
MHRGNGTTIGRRAQTDNLLSFSAFCIDNFNSSYCSIFHTATIEIIAAIGYFSSAIVHAGALGAISFFFFNIIILFIYYYFIFLIVIRTDY